MSNNVRGTDPLRDLWQRAQARPAPVVLVVLLLSLFIALAGYPWVWLVGGAIVLAVLYPSLSNAAGRSGGPPASLSPALRPAGGMDLSRLHGHYLDLAQRALGTQRKIEEAVAQTQDPGQRRVLADSISDLPELARRIYDLALKAQGVQSGLGG